MNLQDASGALRKALFRVSRVLVSIIPGRRLSVFGSGSDMISLILVVNLDRQPKRWQRLIRELKRFRTTDGSPLTSITQRLPAVDARDGRAIAATADVDTIYNIGDQLYVQPDFRLAAHFKVDEPIKMTRQEIAVARSHIEVWKAVATGNDKYVLVLEDDVWFKLGAAVAITRGWQAAIRRCSTKGGPHLLYLSYEDAGGTAERVDCCEDLFRPVRGLWFLSGYVLSRDGAEALLRAMPVIGPVDLWMNYRFHELGALALSSPVIQQRQDSGSDNSYSILPYLARAGIIDAGSGLMAPDLPNTGPVLVWVSEGEREGLAMALAMLGLRVRIFDANDEVIQEHDLLNLFEIFDALINPRLTPCALNIVYSRMDIRFISEMKTTKIFNLEVKRLPSSRILILLDNESDFQMWEPLCLFLNLPKPAQNFPNRATSKSRLFRADRPISVGRSGQNSTRKGWSLDISPWVLPPQCNWEPSLPSGRPAPPAGRCRFFSEMVSATPSFIGLVETFPGNMASFTQKGLVYKADGAHLIINKKPIGSRPYSSGAFVSAQSFEYGRFVAEIKAARGSGLVTGFFLHRDSPRQEIDVEISGDDPNSMLVNVYFNPGDDGATLGFGYRGSPHRVELGFDATLEFHRYTIDWRPGRIVWSVDDRIVHERVSWDPTPIPHLPMRLHANLWAPRSEELAGRINDDALPATATFKRVSVWE
ncbi:family 16 glycosylhydrolase [Klebsiella quasipneumoniae subsp. similipneumoniae]|uniref:Beta-glucanase n=1 Tax=Klebsiella quasipneumoniae TaxID=1463165 RepID=A0A8G2EDC4_9ENTR|nr:MULTISPECIES: family 16 glycosylhydrolase [Klebsiella]AZJ04639.1 glycosyl hydrolase family protein [Klebsiella quasipneumoniae]AZJ27636.1 glycosyl hydrolase family protein [Klebsiella quasipneumoniae subsp. similipneumoniae]ELC0921572.1 family 16 glycosylhydrolase [Klebsiella quasipneumoniae]MBC5045667.1 family 16 glycosylhydrolase [Klebsiella quasipneumoniae]MDH2697391.1 family 16 glycosylhydrolase [Klebsiella quasipneumoniae]